MNVGRAAERASRSLARFSSSRGVSRGSIAAATLVGVLGALVVGTAPSGASVIATGGNVVLVSPPPVVAKDVDSSDTEIHMFTERTSFTIPETLPVDVTPGDNFPTSWHTGDPLSPSVLAAGTPIDSYFMISNPYGDSSPSDIFNATVSFSTPILGLIITGSTLRTTDSIVGAPERITSSTSPIRDYNTRHPGSENPDEFELVNASTSTCPFKRPALSTPYGSSRWPRHRRVQAVAVSAAIPRSPPMGVSSTSVTPFTDQWGVARSTTQWSGEYAVTGQPGYWTVASDGGVFSFGDAGFYGSMGGTPLNAPIVGMSSTPDGLGYWLVASDGGIFVYGDADFYGSRGGQPLNKPIVGMASTPDGLGYWLVASDGGIFAYGDANFYGSTGSLRSTSPSLAWPPPRMGRGTGWWPLTVASSATATRTSTAPWGASP